MSRSEAGALDRYARGAKDADARVEEAAARRIRDLNETIADAMTNALGVKDPFLKDLISIFLDQNVFGPLAEALGKAGSGGGGIFSAIGTALGSIFKGGKASGGYVSGGSLYRVNEGASPGRVEGFMPTGSGQIIPLGRMDALRASGGASTLIFEGLTKASAATKAELAAGTGSSLIGTGRAPGILTPLDDVLDHVSAASFFGIPETGSSAGEIAQSVINELSALAANNSVEKGAILRLKPFGDYDWEIDPASANKEGVKVRPGLALDLQGSRMIRRCHSDIERAFIMMSHSSIRNGRIDALSEFQSVSGSALGTSAGVHGCIGVGSIYGEAGTPSSLSELDNQRNILIENLTLTADKWMDRGDGVMLGAALIQLYGGCHTGAIRNIYAPASDKVFMVVGADWNFASENSFGSGAGANYATYRAQWEAGTLRTYHPANWVFDRIVSENMTAPVDPGAPSDTGSFFVRLSGSQSMQVTNCRAGKFTNAVLYLTAGDPGFEFADATVRQLGMDGSVFRNITGTDSQDGFMAFLDSYADNMADAVLNHGYDAYSDPLVFAGLTVDGVRGYTQAGAAAQDGIRTNRLRGAEIHNCALAGFKNNVLVDDRCVGVSVHDNKVTLARQSNIFVGHGTNAPQDTEVYNNDVSLAGRGGGDHADVWIGNSVRTKVYDNIFGVDGAFDDSTKFNIRADGATGLSGWGNKHRSTKSDGIAESLFSANDYGRLTLWKIGEMLAPAFISTAYGGVNILPVEINTDPDGVTRGRYRAQRTALGGDVNPNGGTWVAGDIIEYRAPVAGGWGGVVCTTGGIGGSTAVFKKISPVEA